MSFGSTIPVTGLMNGFVGQISRLADAIVRAKVVLSTTPNNIAFGAPMVVIPTAGGGDSFQSVADYILGGGTFTAAKLAAIAVREVKTNLAFVALGNNGAPQIGSYAPNQMAEGMERGSMTVQINNGTPASQGPVYVRVLANGGIPAGVVGGFEAVADGSNTVVCPNLIFATGAPDLGGNGVYEVTLLSRTAS